LLLGRLLLLLPGRTDAHADTTATANLQPLLRHRLEARWAALLSNLLLLLLCLLLAQARLVCRGKLLLVLLLLLAQRTTLVLLAGPTEAELLLSAQATHGLLLLSALRRSAASVLLLLLLLLLHVAEHGHAAATQRVSEIAHIHGCESGGEEESSREWHKRKREGGAITRVEQQRRGKRVWNSKCSARRHVQAESRIAD
jgi:hypothetical protein